MGVPGLKNCFREPIPEILDTARYLDAAVSAHLSGHRELASTLFQQAETINYKSKARKLRHAKRTILHTTMPAT